MAASSAPRNIRDINAMPQPRAMVHIVKQGARINFRRGCAILGPLDPGRWDVPTSAAAGLTCHVKHPA